MKWFKRIAIVGVVLVVLLVIGGVILLYNIDGIVRNSVQTQSTKQLNLKTELDSASVKLFGGTLGLKDLKIASPEGFSAPNLLTLGNAGVEVSYGQLRQDPVHVKAIMLDKPTLVIEQKNGSFNFRQAIDQMPKGEPAPADGKPPMKLIIDQLTVQDAKVLLRPNLPGLSDEIPIPIKTFTLSNIGNADEAQNGAAVKDVVKQLITALAANAYDSDQIPPQLKALLKGDLSAVMNELGAQAKARLAKALPGPAGEMVGNLLANPSEALKDPGKLVQEQLGKNLPGIPGLSTNPTTNPSLSLPKGSEDLVGGLFGGKKDKDKKKK